MSAFNCRALRSTLAALAATTLLASLPARAALVSFNYTGQANSGATVQGSFGWETSAPSTPTLIGQGNVILAQRYDAAGFLTGQVSGGVLDGQTIMASGLTWNVQDMDPATCPGCAGDALQIIYSGMFVNLFDDTMAALNSLALPTDLDLSAWGKEHRVRLANFQQGVGALEDFTILSISRQADPSTAPHNLPEPGALGLLALAGAGALAARRRTAG